MSDPIEEALERVQGGLGDREWDCMCDPGSHEDPCPFAALDTLRAQLDRQEAALREGKCRHDLQAETILSTSPNQEEKE